MVWDLWESEALLEKQQEAFGIHEIAEMAP